MPTENDADRGAHLRAQWSRLQGADPFCALGLAPEAEWDDIRQAYLRATKLFHPNRYACETPETRELAHEVFLLIRRAYDQLADEGKRKAWRDRLVPPTPPARPSVSMPAAAPTQEAPLTKAPPAPVVPAVPSPVSPGASASGKHPQAQRGRPITRPPEEVKAMLDAAKTRNQRFEDAQKLMVVGKYQQARMALQGIAGEDPHMIRYRVQLHLAWGYEHKGEGRVDEAVRELERAVLLDPTCTEAVRALEKLQAARKGTGLFSKFFGR
jgi:tetratricopeptide (TPR) repeat protein